jgi:hypothetical protein
MPPIPIDQQCLVASMIPIPTPAVSEAEFFASIVDVSSFLKR